VRAFRSALLDGPKGLRYGRKIMARSHRLIWLTGALMMVAASASAQIDPLLFLKTATPNVIFIVDTGNRMQRGAPTDPSTPATSTTTSTYYDPIEYLKTGNGWEGGLGITGSNTSVKYRRKYVNLAYASSSSGDKFDALRIDVLGDLDSKYGLFDAPTRLAIARAAMYQAVNENEAVARFGLVKMRQTGPTPAVKDNSGPVAVTQLTQQVTDRGSVSGRWELSRPLVSAGSRNGTVATNTNSWPVKADSTNANTDILALLAKNVRTSGALIPAGGDDSNTADTPVKLMIDDARTEAARLIALTSDPTCRCTVAVLIVGGGEGNTTSGATNASLEMAAANFLDFSGRRVPLYVIAIAPPTSDVAALRAVATKSGGQYFEITKAQIDAALVSPAQIAWSGSGATAGTVVTTPLGTAAAAPVGTVIVPEMVKAINTAIQHAFASSGDVNIDPTPTLPVGPQTEFQVTSPIIGTVNLDDGVDITGAALSPNSTNVKDKANIKLPQRSNLMLTAGFAMPGFEGRLRAFRMYKPVVDDSQASGYKFNSDGTRLWVACVPGARCAAAPDNTKRNLYTATPSGSIVPFTAANVTTLAPLMNLTEADATAVINDVRALPIGAIVDSTPAVMNAPSLDPPPDADYPGFAADNELRRTIVWIGTNNGILEAIDARFGVEVWGFIPLNLLPKLRTLRDGQPVGSFDYFVDSSPKLADVKVDGDWRTHLIVGEGPGGTFYQSFDVTMDDMATVLGGTKPDSDATLDQLLSYFANSSRISLNWAFPSYANFNAAIAPYGDLAPSASAIEKSVGQTWSDPAVGPIFSSSGPYAVILGSGFMPYRVQQQANRGGTVAGTTFYLLHVKTGAVYDSRAVTTDGNNETNNDCRIDNGTQGCTQMKNALQTDPVATGPSNSRFVTKSYLGDLDGNVWRFDIGLNGSNNPIITARTNLYASGSDQPIFSSMATVYLTTEQKQAIFFGTGSDLLPQTDKNTVYRLLGLFDDGAAASKQFEKLLAKTGTGSVTSDERVTAFPAVAGDIVFFTTTLLKTLCTAPDANLYAFSPRDGTAAYDSTGDGTVGKTDTPLVKTIAGKRATAPYIVDQHLVFGVGGDVSIFGKSTDYNNGIGQAGVRILSWREVR